MSAKMFVNINSLYQSQCKLGFFSSKEMRKKEMTETTDRYRKAEKRPFVMSIACPPFHSIQNLYFLIFIKSLLYLCSGLNIKCLRSKFHKVLFQIRFFSVSCTVFVQNFLFQ
jgi:hypothetical protein